MNAGWVGRGSSLRHHAFPSKKSWLHYRQGCQKRYNWSSPYRFFRGAPSQCLDLVTFRSDVPPSLPPFLPPSLPVFLSHKHRYTPFLCSQIHCVTQLLLPPLPKKKKRRKERVGKMCNPAKCMVCAESISTT